MELQQTRKKIDEIDAELIALLEMRMNLVGEVVRFKQATGKAILDKTREAEQTKRLKSLIKNKEYEETILHTFESILTYSKEYQAGKLSE
ncbi:chorismate mutase [Pilibacter termitis]|uniref:Chorismate mutase n=1 Tax=Pilibacter termitis TaxID=263852 RepID=A0A1T4P364_9ENTE|nr:chorismate mutase [Pilibacter termitis]SJZ85944.1 chorismate mutase [Pilibacter termitis]